tara:strand:+ start:17921 stop:18433 length:513 start_codon:yes stop_codon:yes gene_type:complete
MTQSTKDQLHKALLQSGLEILNDKRSIFVEKIKTAIVELIHTTGYIPDVNYSDYLSELLGYDYTYLANTFSEVKGTTIQQYIIINKIERAKELLLYNELSLTEISYKLNYSSVAHLSNQFKKITGLTPTYCNLLQQIERKTGAKFRRFLDFFFLIHPTFLCSLPILICHL